MQKKRVHELAKELGLASKELETKIKEWGYNIKNYMSTLEESEVEEIRKRLQKETEEKNIKVKRKKVASPPKIKRKHKIIRIKIKRPANKTVKKETEKIPNIEEKIITEKDLRVHQQPDDKYEEKVKKTEKISEKLTKEQKITPSKAKIISKPLQEEVKTLEKVEEISEEIKKAKEVPESPKDTSVEKGKLIKLETKKVPKEATKPEKKEAKDITIKESKVETSKIEKDKVDKKTTKKEETKQPIKVAKKETKKEKFKKRRRKKKQKFQEKKPLVRVVGRTELNKQPSKPVQETEQEKKKDDVESKVLENKTPPTPEKTIEIQTEVTTLDKKQKKKAKRVVEFAPETSKKKAAKAKKKAKQKLRLNDLVAEAEEIKKDVEEASTEVKESFVEPTTKGKKEKKEVKGETKAQKPSTLPPKASKRKIHIYETIQVGELAQRMGVKVPEVIKKLMELGIMATANQSIDYEAAALVAADFGYEVEKRAVAEDLLDMVEQIEGGEPQPRPPVVTVMGHVDHGKTSLLDAIRKADVASKEAGGITQHIGAYTVSLPSGKEVVFLDTPGHEAFTAMRARGAKVTDIVILVVAADDGVMAQTKEAIDHARAAGVPIIVAINKIDKPEANPERVKRELAELGLIPEEWGGDTIFCEISAKKKIGIEDLLEMLALQAEVLELKADPKRPAKGNVIEAKLDKGRGPVATVLIKEGTLHVGDAIVCGLHHGKVRAMINDRGKRIKEAGPSMPVEIQGLSGVPNAGDEFVVLPDEKKAREVAEYRQRKEREAALAKSAKISLDSIFEKMQESELKELNIVLKTDVQGSLEALKEALKKLSTKDIKVKIVRGGIGAISESDILLASASDAIVIGFNVRPTPQAKSVAEKEHVDVRFYNVIYQAIDDVKNAMVGLLEPVYEEEILGKAEVRQTFRVPKVGTVAGCFVLEGVIKRNAEARLLRDNVVIYTGKIASLRRFKDDVKEVQAGYECGIGLEKFNDIKVGDVIEAFIMKEVKPVLEHTEEESEEKNGNS